MDDKSEASDVNTGCIESDTGTHNYEGYEETEPVVGTKKKRQIECGIVYLSRIPQYMTVKKIRGIFDGIGEVGRIYLKPDENARTCKKGRSFSEGWIEFKDKRLAKQAAVKLNNNLIGGKRRSRWYDELWNVKYLHRFKWMHLNERLAYEQAVHSQRMRTEIAQVKRESTFYMENVEKKKRRVKLEAKLDKIGDNKPVGKPLEFRLKSTEEDIIEKRKTDGTGWGKGEKSLSSNKKLLVNIFSGGVDT